MFPSFSPTHRQNRGKQLAGTGAPPPRLYFSQQKLATQGSHLLQPLKAHSLSVSVHCRLYLYSKTMGGCGRLSALSLWLSQELTRGGDNFC